MSNAATEHSWRQESIGIKAYEKVMKEKHTTFMLKLVVHFLIKNISGCTLRLTFFVIMIAVVRGWGAEVDCPYRVKDTERDDYPQNNHNSRKKKKKKKKKKNSTGYNESDLVVCGFSEQIAFFCERILPDICHWNSVVPKLNHCWPYCVLPCMS